MKKFSKIVCIIAGIMLGAGIILAFIGFALGAKSSVYLDFRNGIRLAPQNEPFVYENYELENISEIDIDVSNAKLEIQPSVNGKFGICINYNNYTETPSVSTDNNRISVYETSQIKIGIFNIVRILSIFSSENTITLYVPVSDSTVLTSFIFHTSNGTVMTDTPLKTESLDIKTSNGSINMSRLSVSKSTLLKTSNGAIICDGAFAGNTEFKTSNGRIEVSGTISDTFNLKTSNGSITIHADQPQSSYSLYADTSNGPIKINGDKVSDDYSSISSGKNNITAKTSNGSINFNFQN